MGDGTELLLATNLGHDGVATPEVDGMVLYESHQGDSARAAGGTLPGHSTVAWLLGPT
jgi:hypothetical protein